MLTTYVTYVFGVRRVKGLVRVHNAGVQGRSRGHQGGSREAGRGHGQVQRSSMGRSRF
jgi:hypothetical protein